MEELELLLGELCELLDELLGELTELMEELELLLGSPLWLLNELMSLAELLEELLLELLDQFLIYELEELEEADKNVWDTFYICFNIRIICYFL